MRTHVYKVLRSSWGIAISIAAVVDQLDGTEAQRVTPGEPVWLALAGQACGLPPHFVGRLAEGLAAAVPAIVRQTGRSPVRVLVVDVSYVESDFQEEGLAVAMCRWAEEEFGLPRREVVESFDRAANRYEFDWR